MARLSGAQGVLWNGVGTLRSAHRVNSNALTSNLMEFRDFERILRTLGAKLGRLDFVMLMKLWKNDSGATAIEYGLIAVLITIGAAVVLPYAGANIGSTFNTIAAAMSVVPAT